MSAAKKSVVFENDPARDQPEYESFALKLAFVGANDSPEIQGEDRLPWNNNYFIGNDPDKWRTDVPNYKKIRFREVYKGIDLVYYGNQKRVKYDFIVKPGEDPEQIVLRYDFGLAGGSLSVNEKGELVVKTPAARPKRDWLARAIASSSVSKVSMDSTGPKISSRTIRMLSVQSAKMVGATKLPLCPGTSTRAPPHTRVAPSFTPLAM